MDRPGKTRAWRCRDRKRVCLAGIGAALALLLPPLCQSVMDFPATIRPVALQFGSSIMYSNRKTPYQGEQFDHFDTICLRTQCRVSACFVGRGCPGARSTEDEARGDRCVSSARDSTGFGHPFPYHTLVGSAGHFLLPDGLGTADNGLAQRSSGADHVPACLCGERQEGDCLPCDNNLCGRPCFSFF